MIRVLVRVSLMAAILAGCAPVEQELVVAEPVLMEAPVIVMEASVIVDDKAARSTADEECDIGDDGIGGTGCLPE